MRSGPTRKFEYEKCKRLYAISTKKTMGLYALVVIFGLINSHAQTLQTLHFFNGSDGVYPTTEPVCGPGGAIYGVTTGIGGSANNGSIYRILTNGSFSMLHLFAGYPSGDNPQCPPFLAANGLFYGTTGKGGTHNQGMLYNCTTNGSVNYTYTFFGTNGFWPQSKLTMGPDGWIYGTTPRGGDNGYGTIFNFCTNGTVSTFFSFSSTNGAYPSGGLTLGSDGYFYGFTSQGGKGYGSFYRFSTEGVLTPVTFFTDTNCQTPRGEPVEGDDKCFYGTGGGGSQGYGTIFRLTTNGVLDCLYSFSGTEGIYPASGLTKGKEGCFYGATHQGGQNNYGSLFKISTNGNFNTILFFSYTNGYYPACKMLLGSDDILYGTTMFGGVSNSIGVYGCGTVYRLVLVPLITRSLTNSTCYVGSTCVLSSSATSISPMVYSWQKNGANLTDFSILSNAMLVSLSITNISKEHAGEYSLVVSNAYGFSTNKAVLSVSELPFLFENPQSQVVLPESIVSFRAGAYGTAPLIFQWYFNGSPFGSPQSNTNISTLTLTGVDTNQGGLYRAQVINGFGNVWTTTASLIVAVPPTITQHPTNKTAIANTSAIFSVKCSSQAPLSYFWKKNGTYLANDSKYAGVLTSNLTVSTVNSNDVGQYSVVITNLAGEIQSSNATLVVYYPPSILTQPVSQKSVQGADAAFLVTCSGTEPFRYQWRFNNTNITGGTNQSFQINGVNTNQNGSYRVVVTNMAGAVTSQVAQLTVLIRPQLSITIASGFPLLGLSGMLSNNYLVQYSTTVSATNWKDLITVSNLSSRPYYFIDSSGSSESEKFYRVNMQ